MRNSSRTVIWFSTDHMLGWSSTFQHSLSFLQNNDLFTWAMNEQSMQKVGRFSFRAASWFRQWFILANHQWSIFVRFTTSFKLLLNLGKLIEGSVLCVKSTPNNLNLQGKLRKVRVIGSSKKIAGSNEKNSFYCTVNILITFNCRNVKWKLKDTSRL